MPQNQAMLAGWGIPEEILNRLGRHAGRQRTMFHEGHLLIILHKVPELDATSREAAFFYRLPNGEWKSNIGNGQKAIGAHLQTYVDDLNRLNSVIEKAITAKSYFMAFNEILPISRAAANQWEALQEAREVIGNDQDLISFRDEAYDIKRTAELLCEEAQHALDFKTAQRAEEHSVHAEKQANASYKLNMIAAFFFPITAIASIFGVNMTTGLESIKSPILFWGVMIIALAVGYFMRGAIDDRKVE